jgi:hypothetical protein
MSRHGCASHSFSSQYMNIAELKYLSNRGQWNVFSEMWPVHIAKNLQLVSRSPNALQLRPHSKRQLSSTTVHASSRLSTRTTKLQTSTRSCCSRPWTAKPSARLLAPQPPTTRVARPSARNYR